MTVFFIKTGSLPVTAAIEHFTERGRIHIGRDCATVWDETHVHGAGFSVSLSARLGCSGLEAFSILMQNSIREL